MSQSPNMENNNPEEIINESTLMKQIDDFHESFKTSEYFSELNETIYVWYKEMITKYSQLGLQNTEKINIKLCQIVIEYYKTHIISMGRIVASHIQDWEYTKLLLIHYGFTSTNQEEYFKENVERSHKTLETLMKNWEKILENMVTSLKKEKGDFLKTKVGTAQKTNTLI